jgi:hypothetical protein
VDRALVAVPEQRASRSSAGCRGASGARFGCAAECICARAVRWSASAVQRARVVHHDASRGRVERRDCGAVYHHGIILSAVFNRR